MTDACNCVKDIESIFKTWKETVDTDPRMRKAFTIGINIGDSNMIDTEAARIFKKNLLQPIMKWIIEHGGSIE